MASKVLKKEGEFVRKAMGHTRVSEEEYQTAFSTAEKELIWIPSELKFGRVQSCTAADRSVVPTLREIECNTFVPCQVLLSLLTHFMLSFDVIET